jgi:transcriptional regulator with XRE-family HTH domain
MRGCRQSPAEGTLGHWIACQRERAGMTQGDLADACKARKMPNANQGQLSRWERNDGVPSAAQLQCIAAVTGASASELSRWIRFEPVVAA